MCFRLCPARHRWLVLLAASYIFYAAWSIPFIGVILFTTSVDYFASRVVHGSSNLAVRRTALWFAIASNLLVLGVFKYGNALLDAQYSLCTWWGAAAPLPKHLAIILPLGISYYTFEAISYLIDVYRGGAPARNWLTYNFYIMYFPHLVSGPIIRFRQFWHQCAGPIALPSLTRIGKGFELILFGYLFKIAFADGCAALADPFYSAPAAHSALDAFIAVSASFLQIYMDFLGYTQIARGVSLLFNIQLPPNFAHPPEAGSMSQFFMRWQITLSQWLHDYVFVPLGGRKRSVVRGSVAAFITLLLAGIWHGAGLNFVALGLCFGTSVLIHRLYRRWLPDAPYLLGHSVVSKCTYSLLSHALVLAATISAAVFFRAPDLPTAGLIFSKLANVPAMFAEVEHLSVTGHYHAVVLAIFLWFIGFSGSTAERLYRRIYEPLPYWLRLQGATVAATVCWVLAASPTKPFIYFQF